MKGIFSEKTDEVGSHPLLMWDLQQRQRILGWKST